MAALVQITITYISTLPSTTSTAVIPVPAGVQNLDSPQTTPGQTGFQAFETMINSISRRGGITFTDTSGILNWIPMNMIVKIQGE